MRAIVTRPAREAERWCRELAARGIAAVALPLIAIAPLQSPVARAALAAAWRRLSSYRALMFVSANAVDGFFKEKPADAQDWSSLSAIENVANGDRLPRCWAPGSGTARALVRAGVPPQAIDLPDAGAAQFDSEALWHKVQPQLARSAAGAPVLIVRGSDGDGDGDRALGSGRDWLARQLRQAGVPVQWLAAYRRRRPAFDAAQAALAAQAAVDGSVWLFGSAQAVRHLTEWLPAQDWARARAVATHPRIAEAARGAGFAVVCESRPTLDDVVASIESLA
ncbi:MAG: Uroporphyrinogen-III synthase [Burkholderiaceae bacterium]|jgi:uroporphyrinogen-III synthase|nr:MAG: Uroporphyrinogen-III synthase [Burkholderiaceae bacterium]